MHNDATHEFPSSRIKYHIDPHTHPFTCTLKFKLGEKKHICFENVIWWHWCCYFSIWTLNTDTDSFIGHFLMSYSDWILKWGLCCCRRCRCCYFWFRVGFTVSTSNRNSHSLYYYVALSFSVNNVCAWKAHSECIAIDDLWWSDVKAFLYSFIE